MAKFVVVKEAPKALNQGEMVITQPDFMEQILANASKASAKKLTGINHLREVINSISMKYDPELNAMRINLTNFRDIPYSGNADLSAIVVKILRAQYPQVFDKVLDHQLQNRPSNTKLVYYVGDFTQTSPFFKAGLDHLEEKDLVAELSGKAKKVVGKPAITNEAAAASGKTE